MFCFFVGVEKSISLMAEKDLVSEVSCCRQFPWVRFWFHGGPWSCLDGVQEANNVRVIRKELVPWGNHHRHHNHGHYRNRHLEQWVGNRGRGSSWSRSCCRGAACKGDHDIVHDYHDDHEDDHDEEEENDSPVEAGNHMGHLKLFLSILEQRDKGPGGKV